MALAPLPLIVFGLRSLCCACERGGYQPAVEAAAGAVGRAGDVLPAKSGSTWINHGAVGVPSFCGERGEIAGSARMCVCLV